MNLKGEKLLTFEIGGVGPTPLLIYSHI